MFNIIVNYVHSLGIYHVYAQWSERNGERTVLLRHRRITRPLVFIRLPAAAILCEGSHALDAKFADRMEWMRERGIRIDLKELDCPPLRKKHPLPGTVIPFSSRLSLEP